MFLNIIAFEHCILELKLHLLTHIKGCSATMTISNGKESWQYGYTADPLLVFGMSLDLDLSRHLVQNKVLQLFYLVLQRVSPPWL